MVSEIKIHIKYIDPINNLGYPQAKGYMKSVADGITKRGDKVVGGFGMYTLSNLNGYIVYSIQYPDNLNMNTYKTYYFDHNELGYGFIEFKNKDPQATTFFKKETFYYNGKLVFKNPEQDPDRHIDISGFSLLNGGRKFLADFIKK